MTSRPLNTLFDRTPWSFGALLALTIGAGSGHAVAGQGTDEYPITISNIVTIDNSHGPHLSLRGCNANPVSNAVNFFNITQGNQVTLQLGLVEGEGFGVTFQVAASEYPIEVNTVEFIIATVANISTTTGYSVLIYDGYPSSGGVDRDADYTATSEPDGASVGGLDDIVLAPANSTCTTSTTSASAARVQAGVDPSADPVDHWFLYNAHGENVFTVIIRVDAHNQNTTDNCGPFNRCQNAFLTTEANNQGALNYATLDWLMAIDCGATILCPDGINTFASHNPAPLGCRPSRDPLIGATWTSQACGIATAACCAGDGTCIVTTELDCAGTWMSDQALCDPNPCPQPMGACCFGTSCSFITQSDCQILSGNYLGNNLACAASSTCPIGACCKPDGTCVVGITSSTCSALSGSFRGVGTTCASPCPPPSGACCTTAGGCAFVTSATCIQAAGRWQGAGVTCGQVSCSTGACCTGQTCSITAVGGCSGSFKGGGSTCVGWPDNPLTCCVANFDQVNNVSPDDLFAYLDAWFVQSGMTGSGHTADLTGNDLVDPDDLFFFLDAWFTGCS
jgi:hypothetical protein